MKETYRKVLILQDKVCGARLLRNNLRIRNIIGKRPFPCSVHICPVIKPTLDKALFQRGKRHIQKKA
jgi:hypothetical protein